MWSFPGARHYDECELYFDKLEDDLDYLDRDNGKYLGRERNYSYTKQMPSDFPNIRRMLASFDVKNKSHRRLAINAHDIGKIWPIRSTPSLGFPREEPVTYFIGCGWSCLMSFER